MVFASGLPITMLGLNVTNRAQLHLDAGKKIQASGRIGDMLFRLFSFYKGGSFEEGLRIHDASTICYLLHPEFFKTEMHRVDVALDGPAAGATVIQSKLTAAKDLREPNVNICVDIDSEKFEQWFVDEICNR
jgi:non-specific riboncleoside hydrolase